jgi:vancomycin resistance protein YoaR
VRRWVLRFVGALSVIGLGLVAGAAIYWQIDTNGSRDEVPRNVDLAGRSLTGLEEAQVRTVVEEMAAEWGETAITLDAGDGRSVSAGAAELGVEVDVDATVDRIMAVRRRSLGGWMRSFTTTIDLLPVQRVVPSTAGGTIAQLDDDPAGATVEPDVVLRPAGYVVEPGRSGTRIDVDATVSALNARLAEGPITDEAVTIPVPLVERAPAQSDDAARELAQRLNDLTRAPLTVRVGPNDASFAPEDLRRYVQPEFGAPEGFVFDGDAVMADLMARYPTPIVEPTPPIPFVADGVPVLLPGTPGTRCCGPEAPGIVRQALLERPSTPPELPLVAAEGEPVQDWAAIGIVEQVSTFTTPHRGGEPRVQNIHRAADELRGTVVLAGETFSLNDTLGARTRDRGYVEAPTIQNGRLIPGVGGGVSQIATTVFNAGFFAGLDFGEYMSHSIYISRYPYGREATVNYPDLDLELVNTTPYAVMIWTEYTDTSITVSMYSTRYWAAVDQTGQSTSRSGVACTSVRTERTRTAVDGTPTVDYVTARYRDAEGLNCDGTETPVPAE